RLVRHVQAQRRDGDPILSQRENIAAVRGLLSTDSHIGDPVISIAATVLPRLDLQPVLAVATLVRYRDALDLSRRAVGKIDVDEHVARYSGRQHAPDDVRCEPDRRLPVWRLAAAGLIGLRKRDRGNAENGPLDRTGDGAGIDHVLAGIAAAVDAGKNQIGWTVLDDVPRAHDHAVSGRAFDRKAALTDFAQPQWIVERKRMRDAGLVELRRDHPDVLRQRAADLGTDVEPLRVDAIVVGHEDAHFRRRLKEYGNRKGAGLYLAARAYSLGPRSCTRLDCLHAAHIGLQHVRHRDRTALLLICLHDGDERAADGDART